MPPDTPLIRRLTRTSQETFNARIPGSKSYTHRGLLIAAMRHGETAVQGGLHCDDTLYLSQCLNLFDGLQVTPTSDGFAVRRDARPLGAASAALFAGAAGTPARSIEDSGQELCRWPQAHRPDQTNPDEDDGAKGPEGDVVDARPVVNRPNEIERDQRDRFALRGSYDRRQNRRLSNQRPTRPESSGSGGRRPPRSLRRRRPPIASSTPA